MDQNRWYEVVTDSSSCSCSSTRRAEFVTDHSATLVKEGGNGWFGSRQPPPSGFAWLSEAD